MRYGSARTGGSKTHLRLLWLMKIQEPRLYAQNNQSLAFIGRALFQSSSLVSFYVCCLILDVVGLNKSLSYETDLECLLS